MNIRTISQLNKITNAETINNQSLFEISQYNNTNGSYSSNSITVNTLAQKLSANVTTPIIQKYGLEIGGVAIKSSDLSADINQIVNDDLTFDGVKTFTNPPRISSATFNNDTDVITKGYLAGRISNNSPAVNPNGEFDVATGVDGFISNGNPSTNLLMWNLSNDTALARATSNEVQITTGGQLVCYGWLAQSTQSADPSQMWVAMEAKVGEHWIITQVQPWNVTTNSTELQYIGFNLPVATNLKIKITTGFLVDDKSTTYQNRPNTLVFNPSSSGTSITNTFIGYVIH